MMPAVAIVLKQSFKAPAKICLALYMTHKNQTAI